MRSWSLTNKQGREKYFLENILIFFFMEIITQSLLQHRVPFHPILHIRYQKKQLLLLQGEFYLTITFGPINHVIELYYTRSFLFSFVVFFTKKQLRQSECDWTSKAINGIRRIKLILYSSILLN